MALSPAVQNALNNIEPDGQYLIKLNQQARHGTSLLRPRDSHIIQGSSVMGIDPIEAIEAIEKVN